MTEGGEAEEGGITIVLQTIVQLVVIALVFLAIFAYIQNIYKDDYFEKSYLAKDLALTIEALQIPSGNAVLQYTKDTNSYTLRFKEGRVEVFSATDQTEPPDFLKGISSFSLDKGIILEDTEIRYAGVAVMPDIAKEDGRIKITPVGEQHNLKLYNKITVDTKNEKKDARFYTTESDAEYKRYAESIAANINAAAGTQFVYSQTNPDFIIKKSYDNNIIYTPATAQKRKLAAIIANKFLEKEIDILILPSTDNTFVIKIKDEQKETLSSILKDSFTEYYNG
jgi:hypothetical protein